MVVIPFAPNVLIPYRNLGEELLDYRIVKTSNSYQKISETQHLMNIQAKKKLMVQGSLKIEVPVEDADEIRG